ncbi:unnamed protein product [Rhizophagus irregularis]|nr:unnamed protein product [Rhizophagus irregularis]
MPCHWLVKGTKEYCTRPTRNEYCGMHTFAINRRGTKPPSPCLICGNGTNSVTQLCIHCGQHKEISRLWREKRIIASEALFQTKKISSLLGSIFGKLTDFFGYYLPSLGNDLVLDDISSDSHDDPPDNGNHKDNADYEESDAPNEYDTASFSTTKSTRLSNEEELWISKTSIGPIIWAEAYEGKAIQYDHINEFYPSVLLQKGVQWPTGSGKFKTITRLNNNLQYGIYRVHIEGLPKKSSPQCSQLFRYNQEEYYTHYDIEIARKNGLGVELINISPNAYVFNPENLMDGKELFEDWAKVLIAIKRKKGIAGKVAKDLLVSLWGILCENPRKNGKVGPHRRMKPFILALARKTITETIRPISNHVKRIHTDGFILTNTIDNNLQVGPNTGDLKCEKNGSVIIKNSINVSWTNTEKEITNFVDKQGKKEREVTIPNELITIIIEYCDKLHPLLFINK